MNHTELMQFAERIHKESLDIMDKKNQDYSTTTDALSSFKGVTLIGLEPTHSILTRMIDKFSRIGTLLKKEAHVKDESIDDTLKDLINYSILLLAYLHEND